MKCTAHCLRFLWKSPELFGAQGIDFEVSGRLALLGIVGFSDRGVQVIDTPLLEGHGEARLGHVGEVFILDRRR